MRSQHLISVFVISIALISCRTPRFIYSPAPPNNPYLREKGESKLAAYYSTAADENDLDDEYNDGLDLQAAYAISNNWALTADHFKRSEKDVVRDYNSSSTFDSSIIRYKRHLTSFGGGYFLPITKDKNIMINIYGGLGFGEFSFTDNGRNGGTAVSRHYNSNMTKWYIQPAMNFFAGKYFRTGLIGKLSWVHYGDASTSYTSTELTYYDLDALRGNTLSFFEATWNMQVALKKMSWLYLDGGFTVCSEPFDNNTLLEARNFNASIGLSIDFSKMKKK